MQIINYKLTILNFFITSSILLLAGNLVEAKVMIVNKNDSAVINNVSVENNTGGQVYVNGKLVNPTKAERILGENNSSASIYTEVNGEVVQDISEQTTGGSMEIHSEVQADDNQANIRTTIEKGDEQKFYEKEIKLSNDKNKVLKKSFIEETNAQNNEIQYDGEKENPILLFWQSIISKIKNIFSIFK